MPIGIYRCNVEETAMLRHKVNNVLRALPFWIIGVIEISQVNGAIEPRDNLECLWIWREHPCLGEIEVLIVAGQGRDCEDRNRYNCT